MGYASIYGGMLKIWIIEKGDLMIREKANSSYLEAICSKASVFHILQYEVINDFISEEPVQITVQDFIYRISSRRKF